MSSASQYEIQNIADLLANARHAVVLTGAGFPTPSGIPDFRSQNTGLWSRSDPMEVASLTAFRFHPDKFFNWLHPLAQSIWQAHPNPGHYALAQLQQAGLVKAILTQNIDGLHQQAGSVDVCEVHGSLEELLCPACGRVFPAAAYRDAFLQRKEFPTCPDCRRYLKPGIVLYEEMLPPDVWATAQWHAENADLFIVAGSSLEVGPVNYLPQIALEHRATAVVINLSETYLDPRAAIVLRADIAAAFPQIATVLVT
jgi:NAD-dependent deacetylase